MDEKLRVVQPCGILSTNAEEDYYLISPEPIPGDSWEGDNCYRFAVVPINPIAVEQRGKEVIRIYDCARQIVTNSFSIEYKPKLEYIYMYSDDGVILNKIEPIEEVLDNGEKTDDTFPF